MRTKWAHQDEMLRTALVKGCLPVMNSVPNLTLGLLKRTFGTFLRVHDRKMVRWYHLCSQLPEIKLVKDQIEVFIYSASTAVPQISIGSL